MGKHSLLWSNTATLQQDEVLFDLSVVGEASHGGDGLVSEVVISGGIIFHQLSVLHGITSTHPVDFLIDLGTVNWILLGCHAPIQATFLNPLWVFLGSFLVC